MKGRKEKKEESIQEAESKQERIRRGGGDGKKRMT